MSKYEGYDIIVSGATDDFSKADDLGRQIFLATLSGKCQAYFATAPDNPVDCIIEGVSGYTWVAEIKNREKCPPINKAIYNDTGWMYEEYKDSQLKKKMNELNAKDALFITITDDYIYIWKVGRKFFEFKERYCTRTTIKNYSKGRIAKRCTDLKIEEARWIIKR